MTNITIWHGTEQESVELLDIMRQWCTCPTLESGERRCAAHEMLLEQRTVDGLLFARRIVERLIVEEFSAPHRAQRTHP